MNALTKIASVITIGTAIVLLLNRAFTTPSHLVQRMLKEPCEIMLKEKTQLDRELGLKYLVDKAEGYRNDINGTQLTDKDIITVVERITTHQAVLANPLFTSKNLQLHRNDYLLPCCQEVLGREYKKYALH
ncbi:MAG: hypothetical protein AABX66_01545 [Nanoarchaeota archaeon]